MKKLLTSCLLTMQRYGEILSGENPFNESGCFFSKSDYLYFVSILLCFVSISPAHDSCNTGRQ